MPLSSSLVLHHSLCLVCCRVSSGGKYIPPRRLAFLFFLSNLLPLDFWRSLSSHKLFFVHFLIPVSNPSTFSFPFFFFSPAGPKNYFSSLQTNNAMRCFESNMKRPGECAEAKPPPSPARGQRRQYERQWPRSKAQQQSHVVEERWFRAADIEEQLQQHDSLGKDLRWLYVGLIKHGRELSRASD